MIITNVMNKCRARSCLMITKIVVMIKYSTILKNKQPKTKLYAKVQNIALTYTTTPYAPCPITFFTSYLEGISNLFPATI